MFHFLCKPILHRNNGCFISAQNSSIVLLSYACVRYMSSDGNQHSFTVSYLIKTYGFSPESALSISKRVNFEDPKIPDLFLSFFKNLGFSQTQISKITRKSPQTLSANLEKSIFPKVEFFISKGASTTGLIRIFTLYPWLFRRSLENQLIPSFNFFRDFHHSDGKTITAIKRFPHILMLQLEADVTPNINTLREYGVPASKVSLFVHCFPQLIGTRADMSKKIVEEVKKMGFDPSKSKFVVAITVLTGTSRSMWDRKVDVYKRWGWSTEDIYRAFAKNPWCMTISEDKLMAVMDLYVNKLNLESSVIAHRPLLLSLSLKKRLVPRASVIQFLSSKGLIKMDSGITRVFEYTEKDFMEKCINCYEEAPQLLKLHNENLELSKQLVDMQQRMRKTNFGPFAKNVRSS
ncbi:transcription termination factor MTERF6, chloroplastic/mitochondrial-like [Ricinus communis]|uniref:transcription termination factor MTERF6, chloroplastic/mitochondrial-like n=1 Tax=Ricinus communis TaxID=3988 RepID=UPI000D6932E6|nr:transcription termination factor MTERF6, chloroplastic/mitochondrial-like [Ricinus communis]|eukprot:XP_025012028.1 transcription termination factor MTERF6, chloroplastic/mitochondrial-like isoform X1 [Ricinus communis]